MDYELSRLNSRTFEHLIQGVAAQVLGPGLVVFGDGPDGGREAVFDGKIPYPSEVENWTGNIVLQAKFLQRPKDTSSDGEWALARLREEIDSYADPGTARQLPDYLIFTTNVTLSPAQDAGAKDKMFELADGTDLRGFDVWDYDKLRVYLDSFEELRRSFAAYILPGDVISSTIDALAAITGERPDFDDAISRFLQKELLADQWANLEQAGRASDEQVPVSRVFVDLAFSDSRQPDPSVEDAENLMPGVVSHLIQAASQRLDHQTLRAQQGTQQPLDPDISHPADGRFVLLGGPGQGKSTIGQFVCQMFRAALLRSRPRESLSHDVTDALSALEEHCDSSALESPTVKRFPLRVELNKFAEELGATDGASSLLEYLAKMISARIPGEVSATHMSSWLAAYPWLLVLDGLDEVPASSNREELMNAIKEFWVDTAQGNADCLVIATTRPQGYSDEFSPRHYQHLWLAPLSTARAMHYARRLLQARVLDDDERRERIAERVERAVSRPDTARLMTSPLQVTIMTTLLERMGQPPEGRWNLFSQYYRVIYDRELERDIPAASVLRDYKPDIDAIHRRVGLLLQVESESANGVEAQIPRARFAEIVKARLREEEHDLEGDEGLVKRIIDTAMERLVFLVGVEAGQVGFEIRSLQEFMAAEALLDGPDGIVIERLRAIAALPAWRNVFLFAAGRCFADLQHLRATVPTICAQLNDPAGDPLASIALPGSTLAIDLLADGVANRQPRFERLLGREALRIVRRPPGSLNDQLAEVYQPVHRENFEEELRAALAVESFQDALAAWRTLAVLGARSQGWAMELVESRLPAPTELTDLLSALPIRARSETLSVLLARLSAESPPFQSLPHRDKLEDLQILPFAPGWYQAAYDLVTAPGSMPPESRIQFKDAPSNELVSEVRSVSDIDERFKGILEKVPENSVDVLPSSWSALFAPLEFARDPSAEALATWLERLATVDDHEDLHRYSIYGLWPFSALVHNVTVPSDLSAMATMAREGFFGDRDDWLKAEARWRDLPIQNVDLAYPGDGEYPFDSKVSKIGFPLGAATVTVTERRRAAAHLALSWLESVRHRPTRRFVVHVIFWLLGGHIADEDTSPLIAANLAAAIEEDDLREDLTISFEALDELEWNTPLGDKEAVLLNGLGRRFKYLLRAAQGTLMSEGLARSLFRAWRENPNYIGLYRLLAAGAPLNAFQDEDVDVLLASEDNEEIDAARALLEIRLRQNLSTDGLEILATSGDAWLEMTIFWIGQLPTSTVAKVLRPLDLLLGSEQWEHRKKIEELATELIARRPSLFADVETWESLKLFERPAAS